MATTNIRYLTTPADNVVGDIVVPSSPYSISAGIQVGCFDDAGNLQITETRPIRVRFFTDSGLDSTYTTIPVAGIATFANITGGHTTTSVAPVQVYLDANLQGTAIPAIQTYFNMSSVYRINPAEMQGVLTAGSDTLGPYRYRAGKHVRSVRISAISTAPGDTVHVLAVEPGMPTYTGGIIVSSPPSSTITSNATLVIDKNSMGGQVDIYVQRDNAATGSTTVKIQRSY